MNAVAKISLADLYKQRAELLKKRDGIQEARAKLGSVDQETKQEAPTHRQRFVEWRLAWHQIPDRPAYVE